jgi:hypothetical protein
MPTLLAERSRVCPEIIVAPVTGARWMALGVIFQSTLHELAPIGGHFFRVRSKRPGKPPLITARWGMERRKQKL